VDEAIVTIDRFLNEQILRGAHAVFLLHGHGTGALKAAVRDWLRTAPGVRQWRPAERGEGGDAFTVVEVE
jgi:DNA mismatch repair protein MutS2